MLLRRTSLWELLTAPPHPTRDPSSLGKILHFDSIFWQSPFSCHLHGAGTRPSVRPPLSNCPAPFTGPASGGDGGGSQGRSVSSESGHRVRAKDGGFRTMGCGSTCCSLALDRPVIQRRVVANRKLEGRKRRRKLVEGRKGGREEGGP